MMFHRPRILISALRGGSGKTVISLGLSSAWRSKGFRVAPFKKGPDFIDAGWHTFAAGRACHNLDPFMMSEGQILRSFIRRSGQADLSVIEGNRGLFDGLDVSGCCSTAELARILDAPVLLIVDATMATRTVAALVRGCEVFDSAVHIPGVILNRVATSRQEKLIRHAVEQYCDARVFGAVPKLKGQPFPERHMGLVPHHEREQAKKAVAWAERTVRAHLQLDDIRQIAQQAPGIHAPEADGAAAAMESVENGPRIGVIRDKAFWFYYPENLEHLTALGAELVEIDALTDPDLPDVHALYIGGGFPEIHAAALAENRSLRMALREVIEDGLPVYAECGGAMYLGKNIVVGGAPYPMVGAIPINFVLQKKPQGHGYTIMEVDTENPYFEVGDLIKGHEFHYSMAERVGNAPVDLVFKVGRGCGMLGDRDGLCRKNLLATYTHVHAGGQTSWAKSLYHVADKFRKT